MPNVSTQKWGQAQSNGVQDGRWNVGLGLACNWYMSGVRQGEEDEDSEAFDEGEDKGDV